MEEKAKVLEVKDLSVSYTVANVKTHILEDVSFAVSKGKSVGIVGGPAAERRRRCAPS